MLRLETLELLRHHGSSLVLVSSCPSFSGRLSVTRHVVEMDLGRQNQAPREWFCMNTSTVLVVASGCLQSALLEALGASSPNRQA